MSTLTEDLAKIAGDHKMYQSSEVSENWDEIVEEANKTGEVVIAGSDVVVLSADTFVRLKRAEQEQGLARLRAEWDQKLAWLNEPGAGDKLRRFLDSTPEEIAASANAAARRE